MATFSDDFNRADETDLTGWTEARGGTAAIISVASNQILLTASGVSMAGWATACDTSDNRSQIALSSLTGVTSSGPMMRGNNGATLSTYVWRYNGTSSQILKCVSNTFTALGSAYTATLSDGAVLKGEASGSTITGYIDGTQRQQVTDTSITSGVYVGIRFGGTTDTRLDDWSGGDLSTATQLVIQDASHGHSADSPSLVQHHVLAVDSATHGHTAESPTLSTVGPVTLTVADALHGHAAESPTLVQHHLLAVADALHGHTAGNVALVQHHVLAVDDADHAQTADTVTLSIPGVTSWWEWDGADLIELTLEGEWNGATVDPLTFDEVYA